jgi:hypothetical protein
LISAEEVGAERMAAIRAIRSSMLFSVVVSFIFHTLNIATALSNARLFFALGEGHQTPFAWVGLHFIDDLMIIDAKFSHIIYESDIFL